MNIDKILSTSTGHVTKEEAELFSSYNASGRGDYPEDKPMPFMIGEYGWLFYVTPESCDEDAGYNNASEGFRLVLGEAEQNKRDNGFLVMP